MLKNRIKLQAIAGQWFSFPVFRWLKFKVFIVKRRHYYCLSAAGYIKKEMIVSF